MDIFVLAKGGGPTGISFAPLNPSLGAGGSRHQGRRSGRRHLLRPVVVGRLRSHGELRRRGAQPAQDGAARHLHRGHQPGRPVHADRVGGRARPRSHDTPRTTPRPTRGRSSSPSPATSSSPFAKDVMEWLIITSTFACAMAFHAAATRYFYAMGREGILNRWLGKTHKRWQSPYAGSFFQSGVAAVLVLCSSSCGTSASPRRTSPTSRRRPTSELYGWLAILGTFLVLVMMTFSGIATIRYFGRAGNRQLEHWMQAGWWRRCSVRSAWPTPSTCCGPTSPPSAATSTS